MRESVRRFRCAVRQALPAHRAACRRKPCFPPVVRSDVALKDSHRARRMTRRRGGDEPVPCGRYAPKSKGRDGMDETILCDIDDVIATVTINRPDKRNALNRRDLAQLLGATMDVAFGQRGPALRRDPRRRHGSVRRRRRHFGLRDRAVELGAGEGRTAKTPTGRWTRWSRAGIPVIAMIHGFCLGGGYELATACDLRIAGESGRFGIPVKRMGLLPRLSAARRPDPRGRPGDGAGDDAGGARL